MEEKVVRLDQQILPSTEITMMLSLVRRIRKVYTVARIKLTNNEKLLILTMMVIPQIIVKINENKCVQTV